MGASRHLASHTEAHDEDSSLIDKGRFATSLTPVVTSPRRD